jgi:PAS domain S-box-containing protein
MDAVFLAVPDGTIVAANPAACRMFGMSEKEICAAGREGLIDRADPNHQKFLEERKSTGKVHGEIIQAERWLQVHR